LVLKSEQNHPICRFIDAVSRTAVTVDAAEKLSCLKSLVEKLGLDTIVVERIHQQ
jgi:hypothetical protein